MRYWTEGFAELADLEETVAWEQLRGLADDVYMQQRPFSTVGEEEIVRTVTPPRQTVTPYKPPPKQTVTPYKPPVSLPPITGADVYRPPPLATRAPTPGPRPAIPSVYQLQASALIEAANRRIAAAKAQPTVTVTVPTAVTAAPVALPKAEVVPAPIYAETVPAPVIAEVVKPPAYAEVVPAPAGTPLMAPDDFAKYEAEMQRRIAAARAAALRAEAERRAEFERGRAEAVAAQVNLPPVIVAAQQTQTYALPAPVSLTELRRRTEETYGDVLNRLVRNAIRAGNEKLEIATAGPAVFPVWGGVKEKLETVKGLAKASAVESILDVFGSFQAAVASKIPVATADEANVAALGYLKQAAAGKSTLPKAKEVYDELMKDGLEAAHAKLSRLRIQDQSIIAGILDALYKKGEKVNVDIVLDMYREGYSNPNGIVLPLVKGGLRQYFNTKLTDADMAMLRTILPDASVLDSSRTTEVLANFSADKILKDKGMYVPELPRPESVYITSEWNDVGQRGSLKPGASAEEKMEAIRYAAYKGSTGVLDEFFKSYRNANAFASEVKKRLAAKYKMREKEADVMTKYFMAKHFEPLAAAYGEMSHGPGRTSGSRYIAAWELRNKVNEAMRDVVSTGVRMTFDKGVRREVEAVVQSGIQQRRQEAQRQEREQGEDVWQQRRYSTKELKGMGQFGYGGVARPLG